MCATDPVVAWLIDDRVLHFGKLRLFKDIYRQTDWQLLWFYMKVNTNQDKSCKCCWRSVAPYYWVPRHISENLPIQVPCHHSYNPPSLAAPFSLHFAHFAPSPPPYFYKLTPNRPYSYALDDLIISNLPCLTSSVTLWIPHFTFYPSRTFHTSISPSYDRSFPDHAEFWPFFLIIIIIIHDIYYISIENPRFWLVQKRSRGVRYFLICPKINLMAEWRRLDLIFPREILNFLHISVFTWLVDFRMTYHHPITIYIGNVIDNK